MKLRLLALSLIIFISSFFGTSPVVNAQTDVSAAAQRCGLAQSYINNILKNRDLYARVDRLQAYQYIYHRIDVFVRRLERNEQKGDVELRASLNKFNDSIEKFKVDYESYDKARDLVGTVPDCKSNLAQFQSRLADARAKREVVYANVGAIQQVLESEIAVQLDAIQQSFKGEAK